MQIHVVSSGQSVYSIAHAYGVSPQQIITDNGLSDPDRLVIGQALVIQQPIITHTVQPGETLFQIAKMYRLSTNELYRNNLQLKGQPMLYPGQTLIISQKAKKFGKIQTNSYAYPFINQSLLRQQLPYLSWFTPFSYSFTSTGELVEINDQTLLEIASNYSNAPLLSLSNLTSEGDFDSNLGHSLLENPSMQEHLIHQLIQTMEKKGYRGLDVDFEYLPPEDRESYPLFLNKLTSKLNPLGYQVFVALAPKSSADQKGILYEAHDYNAIGKVVNGVLLMTYEWGYRYSPPMPVAPLPNVTEVVEYAVSEIPSDKIFLGIPLYGYDWTLPFVQGESEARSISCETAVELARDHNAAIEYDQKNATPYFHYRDQNNQEHMVWFEDARSIQAKLELIPRFRLKGAGYWNLMRPFSQNWVLLNSLFDIEII